MINFKILFLVLWKYKSVSPEISILISATPIRSAAVPMGGRGDHATASAERGEAGPGGGPGGNLYGKKTCNI